VEKSKEDMLNKLYSSIRLGPPLIYYVQNIRHWMRTKIKAMKPKERKITDMLIPVYLTNMREC
jgi:hypothetical protein